MRVSGKGLINREKIVNFKFDGQNFEGFEGDSSRRTVFAVGFHATDKVDVELPAYSQFHEEGEQE